ncbi:hypothetical protein EAF04_001151 [Stromatinia cepivora]|nr:hypothetical protein EAF04_001151 [Stromatinia cepivora]
MTLVRLAFLILITLPHHKIALDFHKYTMPPIFRQLPLCFDVYRETRKEYRRYFTWLANGVWLDCDRECLFMYESSTPAHLVANHQFLAPPIRTGELDIEKLGYVIMDNVTVRK